MPFLQQNIYFLGNYISFICNWTKHHDLCLAVLLVFGSPQVQMLDWRLATQTEVCVVIFSLLIPMLGYIIP